MKKVEKAENMEKAEEVEKVKKEEKVDVCVESPSICTVGANEEFF